MSKRDNLSKVNAGIINTKTDIIDNILEDIPEPKSTDTMSYIRQTFYVSYEELEAIATISYDEDIPKSVLLREILDKGLEDRCPGILKKVANRAERKRQRKNK